MKDFATLFTALDQTNKTNAKVAMLADYLKHAAPADRVWAIALFSHRRPRRTIQSGLLRQYAAEAAGIEDWLFEETYHVVGDLAETISLLLPEPETRVERTLADWIHNVRSWSVLDETTRKNEILDAWSSLDYKERFVFNKLLTGGFRMGISQKLMTRALSKAFDLDENMLAHRLMGNWDPALISFDKLVMTGSPLDDISKPYPFYLAYALDEETLKPEQLQDWQVEWKWDGIRAQLIKRNGEIFLWSRGEELITDQYPEFESIREMPPDNFVLDGELLVFKNSEIRPFQELQTRLGRKKVSSKMVGSFPVSFFAYDLLELEGEDIRSQALRVRRQELISLIGSYDWNNRIILSEPLNFNSFDELRLLRDSARDFQAEGLMIKNPEGTYQSGRKKGDWWKWKCDPMSIDAVMIYAQSGHGRRANLFTDYTFAVWDGDRLVPFTKAYSGLTDKEFLQITFFVRKNTLERFGPVRSVKPELVFEIGFEGIQRSTRHKSGVALRFPRMLRWRIDKPASEAGTLKELYDLLTIES
jgi:DNA ligase 1